MEDCYAILGLKPSASAAEVKRAFRKKAKKLHPDVNSLVQGAHADFNTLLRAYKTLSDSFSRTVFDSSYQAFRNGNTDGDHFFNYRVWLSSRTDYASRSKLILFDLLHQREDDAVSEYMRLISTASEFSLRANFEREDFMDCAFILAEELYFGREFYESFILLSEIILLEKEKPYFNLFFPEVMLLARDIVRTKIAHIDSLELALDAWETALDLGFSQKDDAFFLRKMGEVYILLKDMVTARICFTEAKKLDPAVCIPKQIQRQLGVL